MKALAAGPEGQDSDLSVQAAALLTGLVHGSKRANHRKGAGPVDELLQVPQVHCWPPLLFRTSQLFLQPQGKQTLVSG